MAGPGQRDATRQSPPSPAEVLVTARIGTSPLDLKRFPSDGHVERWADGAVVVDLALDEEGRRRTRREVAGRAWAAGAGVATPAVLAAEPDGSWMVGRRAAPAPAVPATLLALFDVARRVEAAAPPAAHPEATTWRADRWSLPRRAARLVAGGLPVMAFLRARAAAAGLPRDGSAHGDLHLGNVLVGGDGDLLLVDWEFLGPAPRGTDLVRLWSTLPDAAHRGVVLDALLRGADRRTALRLGVLGRWLALRGCAEALGEADPADRSAALVRARAVLVESRALPG